MGQILYDHLGRRLGEIRTFGNRQEIYDALGRRKGYFDGRTTYDYMGRRVGEGNLLTRLI